jgi:hypothetical protein
VAVRASFGRLLSSGLGPESFVEKVPKNLFLCCPGQATRSGACGESGLKDSREEFAGPAPFVPLL